MNLKQVKKQGNIHDITISLSINDPGGNFEYFQGKSGGDLYIKIPKELDINVNVNTLIKIDVKSLNDLRDEYHSIGELYEFRKAYNALLFNEWAKIEVSYPTNADWGKKANGLEYNYNCKYDVHKSWKHNDGELCFGGGWFIVVAILPKGQITNHYKAEDWDLFQIPAVEKAKYEFDGHTPQDTLERMKNLLTK